MGGSNSGRGKGGGGYGGYYGYGRGNKFARHNSSGETSNDKSRLLAQLGVASSLPTDDIIDSSARARWAGLVSHEQTFNDRDDKRVPSGEYAGSAVCFQAALTLKVQTDTAWVSKRPAEELGLIHQFGMKGCPSGPDKCSDFWGKSRYHPASYEDIPFCNFEKCNKSLCIFRHASSASSVANATPPSSFNTDLIARNHSLENELAQSRNMYADLYLKYDKFCSICTGACGVVALLPPPERTAEGLRFNEKVVTFLFSVAPCLQSNQIFLSYAALHRFPWQPTFDDVAETWGWPKPSLQKYLHVPSHTSSNTSQTLLDGASSHTPMDVWTVSSSNDMIPQNTDDHAMLPPPSRSSNSHSPRVITVPTLSTTSASVGTPSPIRNRLNDICTLCLHLSIQPPTMSNLHLAILQLFAPPSSLEHANLVELFKDMTGHVARFDRQWGSFPIMSQIDCMTYPTHAFLLECYFSFLVSNSFLLSVVGQQPPPMDLGRPFEDNDFGDNRPLHVSDGRILGRASLDHHNATINLHKRCNNALLAFHISSNKRLQIIQQLVNTFSEDTAFYINADVSLISQLLAWLRQRPELQFLLSHVTPWINRPALLFKGVGRGDANHLAINTEHPYRNNFVNMIQRVHHLDGYAADISIDPAFIGLYAPDVFDEHAYDPFAFFSYTYALIVLLGFKPGYTEDNSAWCIDRINTTLHYTICNMRWLSLEQNTANRLNTLSYARQQQCEREHKRARKRALRKFRIVKARVKSFR